MIDKAAVEELLAACFNISSFSVPKRAKTPSRCHALSYRASFSPLVMPDPDRASFSPLVMPDPDQASRAISPYLCDASTSLKSGIHVAWILAFARMTAGRRHGRWVPFTGGGVNVLKKRHSCCLDPRVRKDDGRRRRHGRWVPFTGGASMSLKSGISAAGSSPAQGLLDKIVL